MRAACSRRKTLCRYCSQNKRPLADQASSVADLNRVKVQTLVRRCPVAKGTVTRSPALLQFTPKEAAKPERRALTILGCTNLFLAFSAKGNG